MVATGREPWRWVRAAAYEHPGGGRALLAVLWRLSLLFVLIAGAAFVDHRDDLPQSIAALLHESLFRSPHLAQYGERPPHPAVAIWISALAAGFVALTPLGLRCGLLYPLARRRRASVAYRSSLLETGAYALLIVATLFVVGYSSGLLVGNARLDFVPFFVRPLFVTLILLPFAQYFGMLALTSSFLKTSYAMPVYVAGLLFYVVTAMLSTTTLPRAVSVTELGALLGLLCVSQLLYRVKLQARFRRADLL